MLKTSNCRHHILGNKMRKKFDGKIVKNESWKLRLGQNQVEKINDLLEKELKRFQYL